MVWAKGQSGNPTGKPAGARNKATVMVQSILERGAKEITEAVVSLAKEGDLAAARLVLERLVPPAKERPIFLALPDTGLAEGIDEAQTAILKAIAAGELLPGEAATLAGIVEARRKALLPCAVRTDTVTEWNEKAFAAMEVEKITSGFAVARILTIMHAAMFDAVNAVEQRYSSYSVGRWRRLARHPSCLSSSGGKRSGNRRS